MIDENKIDFSLNFSSPLRIQFIKKAVIIINNVITE